jgi:hypothetical protein
MISAAVHFFDRSTTADYVRLADISRSFGEAHTQEGSNGH